VDYKILGHPEHGTFAEYLVIGQHQLELKPAFISWREAAAFPLVGLTTYRALFTEGKLKAGQTVVIPGIGGGAATQALLFAKAVGARVAVTSRSESKLEKAGGLGADLALKSDSDWAGRVRDFTGGKGADIVIETVGKPTWNNSLACLANGGRAVVFGAAIDEPVKINLANLFLHWQRIIGTTMGSRAEFQDMLAFVEAHRIRPVIDRAFPLSDGAAALAYLEGGEHFGKVTLDIQP
jgi:zinc-binding alcohol dehydrogenase/oxidoreductase